MENTGHTIWTEDILRYYSPTGDLQANTRDPFPTLSPFSRIKSTEQPQQPPNLTEPIKSNETQVLKRRLATPPATTSASKYKKEQPHMTQKYKKAYKDILIPSQHRNPTIFQATKTVESSSSAPTVKTPKLTTRFHQKHKKKPNKIASFRMVEENTMRQTIESLHSLIPCLLEEEQPKMLHTIRLLNSAYNNTS
ncbi:hypothetical protein ANN_27785 [Periplaneta americana]|uniref:Uncharacterized protein n=1 Tax=Periplaneta americana TaxID=6978 RepID=A0ABQ8RV45_PERAM|nr:hypothetical protein ANN_27785 [Periplaneta americana]